MNIRCRISRDDLCQCGQPFCYTRRLEFRNIPCGCSHCRECCNMQKNQCLTCGITVWNVEIMRSKSQQAMMTRNLKYTLICKARQCDDDRDAILVKLAFNPQTEKTKR